LSHFIFEVRLVGMEDVPEPRWLDSDEQQTFVAFGYMLVQLPAVLDAHLQRSAGISLVEYQVIAALSVAPERTVRLSKLAEFTASSLSRLSNVVTRLEERGWVRRTPDPDDGRYTLGVLTDAGWDKVLAAAPAHLGEVRRLVFDPLTKAQQQQLHRIAQRIMHAVEPDKPPITERLRELPHLSGRPTHAQPQCGSE
jgi:DNA-binding MarR family transcriptional regulator